MDVREMDNEPQGRPSAEAPTSAARVFFRYPNDLILGELKLERLMMIWVWLAVPLQYYVFTRIPGGMRWEEVFSMALTVMLSILAIFLISTVIAIFPFKDVSPEYSGRVRAWSLAVITNSTAAVTLIAASYLISGLLHAPNKDLLQVLACDQLEVFRCADYPRLTSIETYIIYFGYSLIAVSVVIAIVLSASKTTGHRIQIPAPRTVFVPIVTAIVLAVLYSSTKLSLS
jgi:hypothetical protein